MNRQALIDRFEAEMGRIHRTGVDKLMDYIHKSDFYTAPASTKYHLSCEGGLLQHSLNVLDALRGILTRNEEGYWEYRVAGRDVCELSDENVIVMALLHDICKTHFYSVSTRNAKNDATGKWEKRPYYTVDDKMPLGHGPKSAMIIKQYMPLSTLEMYAIWWHMGYSDNTDTLSLNNALEQYPIIWALHTADMMATHMMENAGGNKEPFTAPPPPIDEEYGEEDDDGLEFQEAPPLEVS